MENPPREDASYLSVCQCMAESQECNSRCVLSGLKWLDHMLSLVLICSSRGWNGAHLVLLHLKPLRTSQSGSAVRRHNAAALIYCSGVILCLRIKRQLNYGRSEGWARAVGDGWGACTRTERQERWKDWDVWSFWLLQATSCSCKLFNMLMENRDVSAPPGQGRPYSLMLQKTRGRRWQAGLKSMIVGRCAFQGSVQKRWTEFVNCNSSLWFLKAFQFAVSRVIVSEQLKLTGYFTGARCHSVICMTANLCKGVNLLKFKLSNRRGRNVMMGLWTWNLICIYKCL